MDDTYRSSPQHASTILTPTSGKTLRLRRDPLPDADAVEAVFLCDLPGFGGPWLTQYAHLIARQAGPVGILHVDPDRIEIELVWVVIRPTPRPLAQGPAPAPVQGGSGLSDLVDSIRDGKTTLPDALAKLASLEGIHVGHWVIELPADRSRETRTIAREFSRWTLLCGSQIPAVEDAAQLLHDLSQGDADLAQRRVGLSLMGVGTETGVGAVERIKDLASWTDEIGLAAPCPQMMPVQTDWLGGFDWSSDKWNPLYRFLGERGGMLHDWTEPVQSSLESPEPGSVAAAAPVSLETTPALGLSNGAQGAAAASSAPSWVDLTAFLGTAGVTALEARYPRDLQTQLAVDGRGVLHLLRFQPSATPALAVEEVWTVVAELLAAQAWAHEHALLLQLTRRDLKFDPSAAPVIHVFTNQGRAAVDLVQRIGAIARVHLLLPVSESLEAAGQMRQWVHTDVN